MIILTDKELQNLDFKLLPKVIESDGFSYRVAEIKTKTSLIEVVNEYRNNKLTAQFTNYEIIEDGIKNVDVKLIKKLKNVIK